MTTRRNIIVGLAVGLLAFGAAITWAGQFNALREYSLFKFDQAEADDWDQTLRPNGSAVYECTDSTDGCKVVVLNVGVDNEGIIDIEYTCSDGAELVLLPSGVLLIQNDCEGAVV